MSKDSLDMQLRDRLEVDAFLANYVLTLDSDRLEEWAELFTDDGYYQVVTRENYDRGLPVGVMSCQGRAMMRDRISALRNANIFEPHVYCHIPGALRIISASSTAVDTESTFSVIRTMVDGTMSLFACGRSQDRLARTAEGLKLARRVVILDSRQIDTLLVIPL